MPSDKPTVAVPSGRDDTTVIFTNPSHPFDDAILDFEIHVDAPQLTVRAWTRSLGGDDLDGFLRGLVEDFRGWDGVRRWRSMEGDFRIDAEHVHGRVRLSLLIDRDYEDDAWHISLPVTVLPGEELSALASEVAVFFEAAMTAKP